MAHNAEVAVIAGASKGLGKAVAEKLSSAEWNLMLVALPGTGLSAFAVYAANKSFLLHRSIALRHELAPLGITVTAGGQPHLVE